MNVSCEMMAILSSAKNTCNRHCVQVAVGVQHSFRKFHQYLFAVKWLNNNQNDHC